MSLFPAYSNPANDNINAQPDVAKDTWLANPSFEEPPVVPSAVPIPSDTIKPSPANPDPAPKHEYTAKNQRSLSSIKPVDRDGSSDESVSSWDRDRRHKHKKQKKKRRHERRKDEIIPKAETQLEFTGKEEYYVDKKPERSYLSMERLHRPVVPKYRWHSRTLGWRQTNSLSGHSLAFSRYYTKSKRDLRIACGDAATDIPTNDRLAEEDFVRLNRDFNQRLGTNSEDIDTWLQFVQHQDQTPQKLSKLQLAERKMDILNRALAENLSTGDGSDACDRLYSEYASVVERAFPSFEVSKILGGLLQRDPSNWTLWRAQIMATQGSMARCVVPDVLKLYEQGMKQMHKRRRYDEVMLKLFTNCCHFLRQSGLSEQLFALLKLTLDLNVRPGHFSRVQPNELDQPVLVEYEEVILASGLPMTEIWLRIEKLRGNFNFLPCPEDRSCPDPQRIVYNEDVVHFVYPLAQRDNTFDLVVRVLQVLKVPMEFQRSECAAHFDAIEDVLAILLRPTFVDCSRFDAALIELVRDFSAGPTYLRNHLGHEIYTGVQTELLLLCAEAMPPAQRRLLETVWLRFERIQVRVERQLSADDCVAAERAKKLRSRVKSLLKRDENRNELRFYAEFAMIEHELGDEQRMDAVFRAAIEQSGFAASIDERSEVAHVCVAFAEMLMKRRDFTAASDVLIALALAEPLVADGAGWPEYKKLQAMQKLAEASRLLVSADREVSAVQLEHFFAPDATITWAKARVYLLLMVKSKRAAVEELAVLLRSFPERTARHRFVRERLYEVYADVVQLADRRGQESNGLVFEVLQRGLAEFPDNLVLVRFAAMLQGQTWFRIRTLLTKSNSAVSVVFLVAAAKYRYALYQSATKTELASVEFGALSSDIDANELTFKTRVCNLLQSCTGKASELRRNALLWRIYLRSLVDVRKTFEESRDALFAALDECPWNKSLYLDGCVYAPQQVTHIQDLIIEKQLRICALPEELEILRRDDPMTGPSTAASGTEMIS